MAERSTDYDSALIAVDPHELNVHARSLHHHVDEISQSVQRIVDAMFHLKLGWAGKTSDEVQDFIRRWNHVMAELFGTEKDQMSGALNAMAAGAQSACYAYDGAEEALVKMFDQLTSAVSGGASAGETAAGSIVSWATGSRQDGTKTAITETW
ncbi:WXG100 family type VII secretion target (plasmid) [Streptomyces sp. NBC_01471]|uniref:WXG100 family type VII secretion target n=1 Tax=Streptomyces sp. NBC_01471 TaxID=2903879 RepID=UPI002F9179E5